MNTPCPVNSARGRNFLVVLVVLAAVLAALMFESFLPDKTMFSNDGPLGRLASECHSLPQRFTGCWNDLNALGFREGEAVANISFGLQYLLGPVWFSKFYAPIALLILGLSAWLFFRELRLAPLACGLGGLAAALNSGFFSSACWGVASHPISVGMTFLALAALADGNAPRRWLRVLLAGLAVGLGVCEGADIGAIYSLYVAAFALWQTCAVEEPQLRSVGKGVGRVFLMAACAGLLAVQSVSDLVATNIEGGRAAPQDAESKLAEWGWATQWSLPKAETLGLVVPGLFGYRMDTPDGGCYWGLGGRSPAWDQYEAGGRQGPPPNAIARHSGGGNYMGVLVCLLAAWAAAQALRGKKSVFDLKQRKWLWFWLGLGGVSLLLAFGKYAPFYRLIYRLPYFSTIRNPVKFLGPATISMVVLFAYGVDGWWRKFLQTAPARAAIPASVEDSRFNARWSTGCLLASGLSLLAWLIYASDQQTLVNYLQTVQIGPSLAAKIAAFSIGQAGGFVVLFAVAVALQFLIFRKTFAGKEIQFGGALLGLLLVVDLSRANLPWIVYFDYHSRYQPNALIDELRARPFEHRTVILPVHYPAGSPAFDQIYNKEWVQQLFPYYNIQSFEVVQLRRVPQDMQSYSQALSPQNDGDYARALMRLWQLTNTRYLLGPLMPLDVLNQQFSPGEHPINLVQAFALEPKTVPAPSTKPEDFTAVLNPNGPFALYEVTESLPRAKLYTRWEVTSNDQAVLTQLGSASFHPQESVFVAAGPPLPPQGGMVERATNGAVEITSYSSRKIQLNCTATARSVLLLNDHYDPNWKVSVDGNPGILLRCNYLMRGVAVEPGSHVVEFRFAPEIWPLYVSLGTIAAGLLLLGFVITGSSEYQTGSAADKKLVPAKAPVLAQANTLQATEKVN